MAVIIGEIYHSIEPAPLRTRLFTWVSQRFAGLFTTRSNPSPFPDHIWRRHSALLDAGWKCGSNRSG